eukprot:scaffold30157_cov43-Prasinocladus_malaysianus.AAC.1
MLSYRASSRGPTEGWRGSIRGKRALAAAGIYYACLLRKCRCSLLQKKKCLPRTIAPATGGTPTPVNIASSSNLPLAWSNFRSARRRRNHDSISEATTSTRTNTST